MNVINEDQITQFCHELGVPVRDHEHITAWLNSTFRRWLLNEYPRRKIVMDQREVNSPLFKVMELAFNRINAGSLQMLVTDSFHILDLKTQPNWVVNALEDREVLHYVDVMDLGKTREGQQVLNEFGHMIDYMLTLPFRPIKHTVDDMHNAVKEWDKRLAKQKLILELNQDTEELDFPPWKGSPYRLVQLKSKYAYEAEGQAMRHCVGSHGYWDKAGCTIFSVRSRDPEVVTPLCTIEVTDGVLEQARGPFNAHPDETLGALIETWRRKRKFLDANEARKARMDRGLNARILEYDENGEPMRRQRGRPIAPRIAEMANEDADLVLPNVRPAGPAIQGPRGWVTLQNGPLSWNPVYDGSMFPRGAVPPTEDRFLAWLPNETYREYGTRFAATTPLKELPAGLPSNKKLMMVKAINIALRNKLKRQEEARLRRRSVLGVFTDP